MLNHLSENEKYVLDFLKKSYDEQGTNPLTSIDLKLVLKNQKDTLSHLQEKGCIEVNKTDLGSQLEMISITLNDKFFSYFNI